MYQRFIGAFKTTQMQQIVSRVLGAWVVAIGIAIASLSKYASLEQKAFYRFGPNDDLNILGLTIDTSGKYMGVVLYCFVNSVMRTMYHKFLDPWLINNVQDESKSKPLSMHACAYEITCVHTIYVWFDWFIYMNILLSQVDMVLVEIGADLVMSVLTTAYYLRGGGDVELEERLLEDHI